MNVVDASWRPNVGSMSPAELKAYITKRDHCSSLVKVTSDLSSLYACKSIHCSCNVKGLNVITHWQLTPLGTTTLLWTECSKCTTSLWTTPRLPPSRSRSRLILPLLALRMTSTLPTGKFKTRVSLDGNLILMFSGLTVMETTNDIMNDTLWDLVKPQSIFTTFRVMVANRMAKNGKEWVEIYARENSGT